MRTRHILFSLAATLTLFSCVKEPAEQPTGGPGDGTATRITLAIKSDSRQAVGYRGAGAQNGALSSQANPALTSFSLPSLSGIPGTRALTPEQETLIANVHILVFDATGAVAANEHFDGLNITTTSNIPLETLPGENMQIVVVANGDVNDHTGTTLDQKLKEVTNIDRLNALLVNIDGDGLSRTERLMMVGTATVTITKPHTTAIPVELHFLDTKVTLTVKDNVTASGEQITITGWDIVNIPQKSYLKERPTPEDAVNGSTPADYTATNGKFPFGSVNAATKTYAHTVYLFENRRGGRVERTDPTNPADKYPGMGVSDNDQRGKAWYAPAGATCVLIYGTYTKDGQMNNVVYKVYLGENPIDDYNLFRGKHYNYNVTVNGLNNINVDTNVEWGAASFSVDHSANLEMDAHPDFRVFRIGGTAVDASTPAYATVEVLESDGTTPCTWLAVSPVNLYRHAVKQSGSSDQQFDADGVGSHVRTKYTPAPSAESEFSAATFAMTRKLTKIPFNQPAVYTYQNAIVYADAYDGTTDRTAKVHITYYKGVDGTEKAGELTYDVTQSGAIRVSDDLYIERYEESAMLMHPGLASGLQNTATMQWGYNTATLYAAADRFTNGNWLTANAVYNTVAARNAMDAPTWTANTYAAYREKYPRTGAKVAEPSGLTTTGEPYFYPELITGTQPSAYFHPIFNSSAARYCHEKNRDTDGDGIISAEETIWYLPSFADMWYISQNMPAGLNLTGTYWTATEENNTNSWGYTFPAKTGASAAKTATYRVRCVRGNGAILPDATIESTEEDKTKINLASVAGSSGAFAVADATGLTWTVTSSDATWLKIAADPAGTGAAASATGTGNKKLYAYVATDNTSLTTPRSARIAFTRIGIVAKVITVTQSQNVVASTVRPTSLSIEYLAEQSAAFTIDNKSSGLEWTVTVSEDAQSWLQIATSSAGLEPANSKSGTSNATLYAYATTENSSIESMRYGTISFSREGQNSITISVGQKTSGPYIPATKTGWAGCNIYWESDYENLDGSKGRLTFDDTDVTTNSHYQGVFFRWGSLVPVSPVGSFTPQKILFSPSGQIYNTYKEIPTPPLPAKTPNPKEHNLIPLHNPDADIGDICKYITDKGWAPGVDKHIRWRLPTGQECRSLGSTIVNEPSSYTTNDDGTSIIIGGIRTGANFYPASFGRTTAGAISTQIFWAANYWGTTIWSATAYDNTRARARVIERDGKNEPDDLYHRSPMEAWTIRCVKY